MKFDDFKGAVSNRLNLDDATLHSAHMFYDLYWEYSMDDVVFMFSNFDLCEIFAFSCRSRKNYFA